jgi:Sulfate permease family
MTSPAIGHGPPTTLELFTPKLVTVFREGYGLADLRADALAGLTVAIVALPLSMAIAIASGVGPERGLYTAIVGGFLVSLLGGSRVQIGGPAGAFIVLVAAVVQRHGYDGLVLATMMAGAIMTLIGFLRLGSYIKFIPYPVTVGFTAGIAAIILVSQLKDLFGLQVAHEPAEFLPKLGALWEAAGSVRPAAVAVALAALVFILVLRRVRPHWPGFLIVVVLGAAAAALGLDVATIGSRFGGIPSMLPAPALPDFSLAKMQAVLPDALAIALLGSIESLLSAVVADGLTGRRHRSNCAGRGEYRLGDIRRHLRHRHHRADRHERSGRRTRTDRRDVPRALRAAVHGDRRAARVVRAAGGAWRDPDCRRLEHVRERRVRRAAQVLARRCGRSARDLPAHGVRRSADRDRSRRRCRLISCFASHGGSRRG